MIFSKKSHLVVISPLGLQPLKKELKKMLDHANTFSHQFTHRTETPENLKSCTNQIEGSFIKK